MIKQKKKQTKSYMEQEKISNKKSSIKVRLIIIPLIVVLLGISAIGIVSYNSIKQSLLNEMKENGLSTSLDFIRRLEDNARSIELINSMIEDKIRTSANITKSNRDDLDNKFLVDLANESDIDEISYYNSNCEIVNSNISELIGLVVEEGHPVNDFMKSNESELMEDIRQDSETGNFVKNGYLKDSDGYFIQVGISADRIQELTKSFEYQTILEEVGSRDEIAYITLIDKNLEVAGSSDTDLIGLSFDSDESIKSAVLDNEPAYQERYYEAKDIDVYDINYPAIINEENVGALSIGYSMTGVKSAIKRNLITIIISGLLVFLILEI